MKKSILILILIALTHQLSYGQHIHDNEFSCNCHQKLKSIENNWDNQPKSRTGENYDLCYHRLEFEVNPEVYYISGKITSYFYAKENNLTTIEFDLSNNMTVNQVMYHGNILSYTFAGDLLQITLPESIASGQLDSISVSYEGAPDLGNGFGSFIQDYHDNTPIIWTLSEPYGAKDWWPCKQSLNDKIDSIDVIVTHPSVYKTASNGVLIAETDEGDERITHWKHRHPIPAYLIAIAVTNYQDFSVYATYDDDKQIEILNYVYPESYQTALNDSEHFVSVMELFNEKFMLYPFADEKYGHAQFGWGGGMEHQTMSFMGAFNLQLVAHEMAHQWFGDYITCGSWHDIWINEGFATYLQGLPYEFLYEDQSGWNNYIQNRINYVTSEPDGSVYVDDTTSVDRIFNGRLSYAKGCMVLHMLRGQLGDDAFFTALQNYLHDPELINGYAVTEDVRYHFEQAADTTLEEFFDDWIYGEGYPQYTINWTQNQDKSIEITIDQSQSHASVDFYEMWLQLKLVGEFGSEIIEVHNTENNQQFIVNIDEWIWDIRLDPNLWLLTKNPTITGMNNEILADEISIYPNPVTDILQFEIPFQTKATKADIYDLTGKLIKNIELQSKKGNISTSDLKSGTYIITFEIDGQVVSKQFTKR